MIRHQSLSVLFALLSILLLSSCNDKPTEDITSTSMLQQLDVSKTLLGKSRSFSDNMEELPRFDIIYEGSEEHLLADHTTIKSLIETYNLKQVHSFELNDAYKGITFEALLPLDNPIQLGKDLSLSEQVMMVEVSNAQHQQEEYM
ncbi:MAG: hypothetical protein AB8E82_16330 [Aureispira sp.]